MMQSIQESSNTGFQISLMLFMEKNIDLTAKALHVPLSAFNNMFIVRLY